MSKSTKKHAEVNGFCQETMKDRIDSFKKYKGEWRRVDSRSIMYTNVIQTWKHISGEVIRISHFSPWGMKEYTKRMLESTKCKRFNFLPSKVKESKFCSQVMYRESDWTVTISNSGVQDSKAFNRLYCNYCHTHLLPELIKKHSDKLNGQNDLITLINKWDELKIADNLAEYVGCFLPWEKETIAGPNSRHFIREPGQHPQTCHAYTLSDSSKKRVQKQASLAVPSKTLAVDKDVVITGGKSASASPVQTKLVSKNNCYNAPSCSVIPSYFNNLSVKGRSPNRMTEIAKEFCCSVVHTGCKKMTSNVATIENYEAAISGIQLHYEYYKTYLGTAYPGALIPAPVKLALNTHNINDVQRAILDAYRFDEKTSICETMRKSPFWSLMHDGISKFGTEFNGVCLRGIDDEYDPIAVPFILQQMKGGVNAFDTASAIIENIAQKLSVVNSAASEIETYMAMHFPDQLIPKPPSYFKLGKLGDIEDEGKKIHINLSDDMPICNTGDGVAVNVKAARVLRDCYGMLSPDLRCAAHIADGVLKRLAKSKTMSVAEVTELYTCLRTIIKHFEASIKNKELLDECMEILEMSPVHLISWCQTRMAHFLSACRLVNESLVALYDVMYNRKIRVDERDVFFTANNIYIVKVLADIEPFFQKLYLRKADKTSCLASTVYNTQQSFADTMKAIATPSADKFHDSLFFDENGNLMCIIKVGDNEHTLLLNHPHKKTRGVTEIQRLQNVKDTLASLKTKIKDNMVENILDQCSEETFFYNWSGLDLEIPLSTADRVARLHELISLFCTETSHLVSKYTNSTENDTEADKYFEHEVYLHYPKKIDCSVPELKSQTEEALVTVGQLWLKEVNAAKFEKRPKNQLNVWKQVLSLHSLQFPLFCQLVQINIATAPNTSPLERSYTKLQMLTEKRRSRTSPPNLEIRWLISALDIPVKGPNDYELERKRLEGI